jgi:YHS domain-containing protein
MRQAALIAGIFLIALFAYVAGRRHGLTSASNGRERHALYYVDPMHPAYKSNSPGIAPDCGMKLEPVYADDAAKATAQVALPLPPGAVQIDGSVQQLLGIGVGTVEVSGGTRTIRAVGRVAPEDTRVYRINAGIDGFIRDAFGDSVGTFVRKDQKLASYYSPEVLPVASGLLAAAQAIPGAVGKDGSRTVPFPGAVSRQGVSSLQGYADRLRNLGMSDFQIQAMIKSKELPESIDVVSPADGFILAKNISAGQHFDRDMEFYRVADLSRVWVNAEVYEEDARYLPAGTAAEVRVTGQSRALRARVTDALPETDAESHIVKIRLEAENPGSMLRPDMLVNVELPIALSPGITVPVDAVVDSGALKRVYVERSEGVFEPREVETGRSFGDRTEIVKGLSRGERVVTTATFLVDSESRLKGMAPTAEGQGDAPAKAHAVAAETVTDPVCGMGTDKAKAIASGNVISAGGKTYYFCSARCKSKFHGDDSTTAVNNGAQP